MGEMAMSDKIIFNRESKPSIEACLDAHNKSLFVELLDQHATQVGVNQTPLPEVSSFRVVKPSPRQPVVYEPAIVIVGQGGKRGYVGEQTYTYDAYNYLVLSVPLPFECEIYDASPESPLLGLRILVDALALNDLLIDMGEPPSRTSGDIPKSIYSTPLNDTLIEACIRLVKVLSDPAEAKILGPQILREIYYRVLCGDRGETLRAAANHNSRVAQIAKVLNMIHQQYDQPLDIDTMARAANMSPSTLHHNFKAVTDCSPLQYLKSIRLHQARNLLARGGINASTAAMKVGYVSPSQFSREFKRLFGAPPRDRNLGAVMEV